jgi:FkbM family methyltransferase
MLKRLIFRLISLLPRKVVRRIARWFLGGRLRRRIHNKVFTIVGENEVTIKHGDLAGFRFTARGSNPGYLLGASEPLVQQALSRRLQAGMVLYDIGANVGFFTLLGANAVGPSGHVYAFEPIPQNAAVLRHNLALNGFENFSIVDRAVSENTGEGEMDVESNLVTAALSSGLGRGGIEVEVISIDDAIKDLGLRPPDVVKIDVEGDEIRVIRGMRQTLERFQPIVVCEIHHRDDTVHKAELLTLLRGHGYEVADLEAGSGGMPHWAESGGMPHVVATPAAASAA